VSAIESLRFLQPAADHAMDRATLAEKAAAWTHMRYSQADDVVLDAEQWLHETVLAREAAQKTLTAEALAALFTEPAIAGEQKMTLEQTLELVKVRFELGDNEGEIWSY
jgi:hypothetical protein